MNKYQEALKQAYEMMNTTDFGSMKKGCEALKVLQELVDKATPKNLIRFIDKFYVSPYKCPVCKTIPHTGNQKYCDECGQALDWSKK